MRTVQSRVGYWYVDGLILSSRKTLGSDPFDRSPVPRVSHQRSVQSGAILILFVICTFTDVFPDRGEKLEKGACPYHEEQIGLRDRKTCQTVPGRVSR